MEYELEERFCVGAKCHGTFKVMASDPQKWCSVGCALSHGDKECKEKIKKAMSKPLRSKKKKEYIFKELGEVQRESNERKETVNRRRELQNRKKEISLGEDSSIELAPRPKKEHLEKAVNITNETKKILIKKELKIPGKTLTKIENSESIMHETESSNLEEYSNEDEQIIPSLESTKVFETSSQASSLTGNLIDDSAKHCFDLMKKINEPIEGVHQTGQVLMRVDATAKLANSIRDLMKVKIEAMRVVNEVLINQ